MANSDVLVRMKADTKNYDANIAKASKRLDQFKKDNLSLGGVMKQASSALLGMAGQFMTIAAAAKVVTDAFRRNEEMLDDWNGTVAAAKASYDGFITALNTGDLSGFFSRLGKISKAARDAYNTLDKLGTFNAFNQINLQRVQTNFTETIAGYREGNASQSDVRDAANAWKNELEKRRRIEMDTYLDKIKEVAAAKGVDEDMLTKALSGSYGDYETLKATQMPTKSVYNSATRDFNDVIDYGAASEVQKLGQALRQLNDEELQSIQGLGRQAEATANEIAQIDKQVVRALGRGAQGAAAPKATTGGMKLGNPYEMPAAGSLADLERQAQIVRNSMGGAINATEYKEMEDHLNTILAQIREIKGEKEVAFAPGSLAALNQELKAAQDKLALLAPDTEEWAAALADVQTKQAAVTSLQDKMTVKVAETVNQFDKVRDSLDKMSAGIGAISALGNALDNLKNIGEDLASAFSGEMDAWDALMTVFNSGIGILETVVGVMDAINTLSELASMLSKKRIVEQGAETAAVVSGKASEAAANTTEAGTSMVAAGANTAQAAAGASKAVSWIPIVGPILAVAAVATVLGATLAAISKAKSAGSYAEGGIIPGNSFTGDRLTANVNSGELILNRAQQANIAAQLSAGDRGAGAAQSNPFVTGETIVLGINNFLGRSGQGEIVTTSMLRRAGVKL